MLLLVDFIYYLKKFFLREIEKGGAGQRERKNLKQAPRPAPSLIHARALNQISNKISITSTVGSTK